MSEKLTAGIIGLGILGGQHMQFLSEQPEIEVKAVADIRKDAAERAAHEIGAQAYDDYEAMLKKASEAVATLLGSQNNMSWFVFNIILICYSRVVMRPWLTLN